MKKIFLIFTVALLSNTILNAQQVDFTEYDLDNGMHVILHQDNTAPVVTTAVMYHVGAKDENPERTGFAHFFEHLLFEGTANIPRGEWFTIVTSNGGSNNANTTDDRTYYYEIFPSNSLELGLWMESERLLHPVINQIGVDTQNEVVKEEKRLRVDNQPYGNILAEIKKLIFKKHPYKGTTIGEMEHLDAATLEEFQEFKNSISTIANPLNVQINSLNEIESKKLDIYEIYAIEYEFLSKYENFIQLKKKLSETNFKINLVEETIVRYSPKSDKILANGIIHAYVFKDKEDLLTKNEKLIEQQKINEEKEAVKKASAEN